MAEQADIKKDKEPADLFSAERFRKEGHELIDLLADHLVATQSNAVAVNEWQAPEDQLGYWRNYQFSNPTQLFADILDKSMHVHHPNYMGHQVAVPQPTAVLAGLLSEFLNNGMAIYEMGAVSSTLERIVVEWMCSKISGWQDGGGILTSGGTLANLTALLTARAVIAGHDVWELGAAGGNGEKNLAVMVSEEAHYCVDRALRIMGFGSEGIIKVPVTEDFRMNTAMLESEYVAAEANGRKVIAVVGSAPTTSTGMHDPLEAIGQFCRSKKIWFHIDAAHGGAAILSAKYQYLLNGLEAADSVAIDGHKMMMMPALTTFLLYKKDDDAYKTFSQRAEYLWSGKEEKEWFNIAKRSFECTKYMMSIKTYTVLKTYGELSFEKNLDYLYNLGKTFAAAVRSHEILQLAHEPDCNIVCFRYFNPNLSIEQLNEINAAIRKKLLAENEFYIVQTVLKGEIYLRVTLMNHGTNKAIIDQLLERVIAMAL